MNLELMGFIAILLIITYIYVALYKFIDKELIKQTKIISVAVLGYVIFKFFQQANIENNNIWIWTPITTLMIWGIAHTNLNRDISKKFRAEKKEKTSLENISFPYTYKRASQFSNKDIPVYVRFTLYELKESDKKIIFDSSDYSVINKEFGTFENIQQRFIKGVEFTLKNTTYIVESVQVDMVSLFDDYSGGHTKVYEGADTPYNIQVFTDLKQLVK